MQFILRSAFCAGGEFTVHKLLEMEISELSLVVLEAINIFSILILFCATKKFFSQAVHGVSVAEKGHSFLDVFPWQASHTYFLSPFLQLSLSLNYPRKVVCLPESWIFNDFEINQKKTERTDVRIMAFKRFSQMLSSSLLGVGVRKIK